jgi:hypothetical protein
VSAPTISSKSTPARGVPLSARCLIGLVLFTTWAVIGCGAPATTVTGIVTFDGEPTPGASIQFYPADGKGQPAGGTTDDFGRFRVVVSSGRQKVVISKREVTRFVEDKNDLVDGGTKIVEELLPARYAAIATTPLTADPVAGQTTTLDFALTSTPD